MEDDENARIKVTFGNKVRELRTRLGYSQEEFAYLCGLDRTYIGGIERGRRNVSLINIIRISSCLKVHPAELFASFSEEGHENA